MVARSGKNKILFPGWFLLILLLICNFPATAETDNYAFFSKFGSSFFGCYSGRTFKNLREFYIIFTSDILNIIINGPSVMTFLFKVVPSHFQISFRHNSMIFHHVFSKLLNFTISHFLMIHCGQTKFIWIIFIK